MLFISVVIGAFMSQQKMMIAALHEIALAESSMIERPVFEDEESPPFIATIQHQYRLQSCRYQQKTLTFPAAPQFIILGAQKAGTSALADFLDSHPQMEGPVSTKRKYEAHFLDWMVPKHELREQLVTKQGLANQDELFCKYQAEYSAMWNATTLTREPHKVPYEKTPSYLFLAYQIPDLLPRVCPWKPKLLAILRNPIDRAWSQFNMDKKMRTKFIGTNDAFEDILEREVEALREYGLSVAPRLSDLPHVRDPRFALPTLTPPKLDAAHQKVFRKVFLANYLQRGMYAVQLARWKKSFGKDLMVVNYDDLFGPVAQHHFNAILRFVGVDERTLPDGFEQHWSRHNYRRVMSNTTRAYLESFFQPYNEQLSGLLGESWSGVWTT
jgi:Sulfotransferase family